MLWSKRICANCDFCCFIQKLNIQTRVEGYVDVEDLRGFEVSKPEC